MEHEAPSSTGITVTVAQPDITWPQSLSESVVFVEILDQSNEVTGQIARTVNLLSAAEAFRKYNWLDRVPVLNQSGNLRGMVLNSALRTVYQVTDRIGTASNYAGNVFTVISIAEESIKSWDDIKGIVESRDDTATKSAKLATQVFGICSRVIWKTTAGAMKAATWTLRHTSWINVTYWIDREGFVRNLDELDATLNTITMNWDTMTDGDTLYYLLQVNING